MISSLYSLFPYIGILCISNWESNWFTSSRGEFVSNHIRQWRPLTCSKPIRLLFSWCKRPWKSRGNQRVSYYFVYLTCVINLPHTTLFHFKFNFNQFQLIYFYIHPYLSKFNISLGEFPLDQLIRQIFFPLPSYLRVQLNILAPFTAILKIFESIANGHVLSMYQMDM